MKTISKTILTIAFLSFSLSILSCASTNSSSIVNPKYSLKSYQYVLVSVQLQDLELKKEAEIAFVEEFKKYGIDAYMGIEYIPPLKVYTPEEIAEILHSNNFDGAFSVQLTNSYTKDTYQTNTNTYRNYYGGSSTYTTGNTISKPRLEFQVNLIDCNSYENAWVATSLTRGNAYADASDMLKSLAKDTVKQFALDAGIPKLEVEDSTSPGSTAAPSP